MTDHTLNREDRRAELPATPLLEPKEHDCNDVADCRGDDFCDRGKCVHVMVDLAGHGYGAYCKRVEDTNALGQLGTCLAYVCVDNYCSSCLGDEECYEAAPYCIQSPLWSNGSVCSSQPSSYWYEANGDLRLEHQAEYEAARNEYQRLQELRAMVNLPVDIGFASR